MIAVENLSVRVWAFGLSGISFSVPAGSYAVLMGRTGCGKTMLLEAICGLNRLRSGSVRLMGADVSRLKPAARGVGYVPQDRALFMTMSVYENIAFAMRIRRWAEHEIDGRVRELADVMKISHLLPRRPSGLSGGESQRVALGRALAPRPRILLLDEPLSALDDPSRREIHELLNSTCRNKDVTVLHVTHHQDDARQLADRLLVMEDGVIRDGALE